MARRSSEAETMAKAPDIAARLQALTQNFGDGEWLLLGSLAAEQKLPRSVLEKLAADRVPRTAIDRWQAEGLVIEAGVVYPLAPGQRLRGEHALAIQPEFR